MKYLKYVIILICPLLLFCNKEHLPEYYFMCKVNGQEYIPNKCANCIQAEILEDTILMLRGNRDFETLGIGIIDSYGIKVGTYLLNESNGRRGDYKFTPATNDRYFTNDVNRGQLTITAIDKVNSIIVGNFSFKAYNSLRNEVVDIIDGRFRLIYRKY